MRDARTSVRRSLVYHVPLFLGVGGVWVSIMLQPVTGGAFNAVGTVIVTPIFALVAWQFSGVLRDLRAPLVRYEGEIRKKWSRFDLPFSRSYYLHAGGNVFKVPAAIWVQVLPGDYVELIYLPHTATIDSVALLPRPSGSSAAP